MTTDFDFDFDDLTLEEYLDQLPSADKKLIEEEAVGFPLTHDKLLSMDNDELNEFKARISNNNNLAEEQKLKVLGIIEKIVQLHIYAVLLERAKANSFFADIVRIGNKKDGDGDGDGKKSKVRAKAKAAATATEKDDEIDPLNTPGCISYQINSKPDKYIVGTTDHKLVELERKWSTNKQLEIMTTHLVTNKTFTACKPVRIVKHKNPLSFLELLQRYTIEFKGSEASGNFTAKHKTLSEIVSELKNGNALSESGIDVALTAQIKGFEQKELLEFNDDMNYIGFFTDESKRVIISSNIGDDITTVVDTQELREALEYINQLAKVGFEKRLDLLAHTIKFGMIAPCSFIFKIIKAPVLEWMDLWGKPNASKSTSGKIILAMDGHHKDDDYNVNMAHVDTIARLGDTVSETTFPKLVDEMDFTDNKFLTNNVKSAIDQPRLRKVLDRSRRAEYIPALSPLVMTSNPPPPLHDAAFMKRIAARYFSDTETHLKDEQAAKDFDALLLDLDKLQALGRFRNGFIMENQDLILDRKLTPFEKSQKIAIAAYEACDMLAPCWLIRKQLEQNHLEESIIDAKEAVLDAFRNLIIDKIRNFKGMNDLTVYKKTSERFDNLVANNMLSFARRIKDKARQETEFVAINTGIIKELQGYGITREQLSNLKALSDYTGGKWHRADGKTVVEISNKQLKDYFGDEDEPT